MDGARFDRLSRALADLSSRRRFLGLGAGLAAALSGGGTRAAPKSQRCRDDGRTCRGNANCCSGYCPPRGQLSHRTCTDCKSGIICGDFCCPSDALIGCTAPILPGGKPGCLCPEGTFHDRELNQCRCFEPGAACDDDAECCSGACCEGTCCSRGEVCSVEGVCVSEDCCSSPAICGQYSTEGLCCTGNQWFSECCCESAPGRNDGFARCCEPGVDCVSDLTAEEANRRCPRGSLGVGSTACPQENQDPVVRTCCATDLAPCCKGDSTFYLCAPAGICTDAFCVDELGPSSPFAHCCD